MNLIQNHCDSFNDPVSAVSFESSCKNIVEFPALPAKDAALSASESAYSSQDTEAAPPARETVPIPENEEVFPARDAALSASESAYSSQDTEAAPPAKDPAPPAKAAEEERPRNRQEMPYERFLSCGAGSLTNAELLAIILRTGTKEKNATQLSREILGFYKEGTTDLSALHRLTREDLMSIPGIGEVKAVKILSLAEISKRLVRERAAKNLVFSSPSSVADYYMEELRHLETETAILVMLDNRLALLREEVLSHGTVNCTLLSPREIFLRALRWGAVNIMLLHNHPSGDPTPSRMDLEITGRICRVGNLLGIHLIDHLVIGDLSYTSLRECGCITDSVQNETSGAEEDSSDIFQGDLF